MRISDWSSDVCSSDLRAQGRPRRAFPWSVVTRGPMRRVLATAGILGLLTIGDGFVYLVLQSRGDFAAQWFPLLYVGTNVVLLALAVPQGRLADRVGRARVFVLGHFGLLAASVMAAMPVDATCGHILCMGFLRAFLGCGRASWRERVRQSA